ncbi:alpha/beta hydrolase [Actinomadura sp. RB99]|uniref:alpha/beta hydrolase n=1 Tax=Actinomadura sp. RB99 TaxID=2691577 RepID=UPI00168676FC|nr:alpha/beta hydrolase [Actinomadura sp. RB99]
MPTAPSDPSGRDGAGPSHRPGGMRLDPELAAMQVLMPRIDIAEVEQARATEAMLVANMRSSDRRHEVETTDSVVPRPDGTHLAVRGYRPRTRRRGPLPMLLFIHGGSFVTGDLETEDARCEIYAAEAECVVFAVDYRLAPENPFPAGLDDCSTALAHLRDRADEFGIDNGRVAIGGLSAGGALASGTALRCGGDGRPALVLQMLLFPVLDAGLTTHTARHYSDTPVLTHETLRDMWRLYLGPEWRPGQASYPVHSSPAHEPDLSLSPPTYLCTAGHDPLRDEALEHAQRLMRAEVQVDLRVYARGFHSFDSFHATRLGRSAIRDQVEALRAAFA